MTPYRDKNNNTSSMEERVCVIYWVWIVHLYDCRPGVYATCIKKVTIAITCTYKSVIPQQKTSHNQPVSGFWTLKDIMLAGAILSLTFTPPLFNSCFFIFLSVYTSREGFYASSPTLNKKENGASSWDWSYLWLGGGWRNDTEAFFFFFFNDHPQESNKCKPWSYNFPNVLCLCTYWFPKQKRFPFLT